MRLLMSFSAAFWPPALYESSRARVPPARPTTTASSAERARGIGLSHRDWVAADMARTPAAAAMARAVSRVRRRPVPADADDRLRARPLGAADERRSRSTASRIRISTSAWSGPGQRRARACRRRWCRSTAAKAGCRSACRSSALIWRTARRSLSRPDRARVRRLRAAAGLRRVAISETQVGTPNRVGREQPLQVGIHGWWASTVCLSAETDKFRAARSDQRIPVLDP